jgi:hypothetical protein
MARPLRVEFEDAIYHLCARGNARSSIFRDARLRSVCGTAERIGAML